MPVYEVRTQKRSSLNAKFENRYYISALTLSESLDHGQAIAGEERLIFGSGVNFYNVHTAEVGTDLFSNRALNMDGNIATTAPMKSEICAELRWPTEGAYPHYKKYRVQVAADKINGIEWITTYKTLLENLVIYFDTMLGIVVTKGGLPLDTPTINQEYVFQQLSKRWYNRVTP